MISKSIKVMIDDTDQLSGRIFALTIQVLILLSLISFSIDTLPSLTASEKRILHIFEIFTVIIFTIEYILRVLIAANRMRFIFSFYSIVDLLAILPFYLASGFDLRALRIVRLLRVVRILKLIKYAQALKRFQHAFIIVKEELILFGSVSAVAIYLSAVGIYYFENAVQPEQFKSIFHCLWWALTTLTTVGYGDMYPITVGGKIFTFFVLIFGLGIVAVPTGLIATALSQVRKSSQLADD